LDASVGKLDGSTTRTRAHIAWCPIPQNSWHGIRCSPGSRNVVRTVVTYPGTTIALTFVPWTMKPCTTSALARRNVTGLPAGTTRQFGINAYCCATTRTSAEPPGGIRVPILAWENPPPWSSEVESIASTGEGG